MFEAECRASAAGLPRGGGRSHSRCPRSHWQASKGAAAVLAVSLSTRRAQQPPHPIRVCLCLRLRSDWQPDDDQGRSQARLARPPQEPLGLGGLAGLDHHQGYLPWWEYERMQRLIADNANGKGMMVRGTVRRGETLLAGLARCGHCGRRMLVPYHARRAMLAATTAMPSATTLAPIPALCSGPCGSTRLSGPRSCGCCSPSASKATVHAHRELRSSGPGPSTRRQIELALEQARYEAGQGAAGTDAGRSLTAAWPLLVNSSGGGRLPSPHRTGAGGGAGRTGAAAAGGFERRGAEATDPDGRRT